jgi:putative transposase
MARRLRIQFPGARYHVINRGNLQHDVFATSGAKRAFLATLGEAAEAFGWRPSAFVIMRNHYHVALETPEPNLVVGMHWLQSTFAIRLTRFHRQHGHVFQGRYKALLIEDGHALARVCDYIHLNPVRAGIVRGDQAGDYRWSSLWSWLRASPPPWLHHSDWFAPGAGSTGNPWAAYRDYLAAIAADAQDDRMVLGALSRGWAIGTAGWRRAMAREHAHLALAPEMSAPEIAELKAARWQLALETALRAAGRNLRDAELSAKGAAWKIAIAAELRQSVAAPFRWIADTLKMGHPGSVRGLLSRQNQRSAD